MTPGEKVFRELLEQEGICTLATASLGGTTEAATVEFTADDDWNLYFETFPSYRKYHNLIENPRASIVIHGEAGNVQLDGTVEQLEGEQVDDVVKLYLEQHPRSKKFHEHPDIKWFRFTPTWIRVYLESGYPPRYELLRDTGIENRSA